MDKARFVINTSMSKEDYRKFLYIATFRRNKVILPMMALFALIGSIIINLDNGNFNYIKLVINWILLFALAIVVVIIKVERRNSNRIKTDKTGTFDSINTLKFYDDRMIMENETLKSTGELKYNQYFAVMESKDYFIFYFTVNQASLIRKKDIDNLNDFRDFILETFKGKYKKI